MFRIGAFDQYNFILYLVIAYLFHQGNVCGPTLLLLARVNAVIHFS